MPNFDTTESFTEMIAGWERKKASSGMFVREKSYLFLLGVTPEMDSDTFQERKALLVDSKLGRNIGLPYAHESNAVGLEFTGPTCKNVRVYIQLNILRVANYPYQIV